MTSGPALLQRIALVLCGDIDGSGASLEDGVSVGEDTGAHEDRAATLTERSLLAMARSGWGRAEILASQARTALRRAGIEEATQQPLSALPQAGRLHPQTGGHPVPRAGLLEG